MRKLECQTTGLRGENHIFHDLLALLLAVLSVRLYDVLSQIRLANRGQNAKSSTTRLDTDLRVLRLQARFSIFTLERGASGKTWLD